MSDMVERLFNTNRIKSRSKSTVRHTKMDGGMFDRMVEDASKFRAEVERAPELDATGEGSDEYVPHWRELTGDVFKSLFTHDDPAALDADAIKPSYEVNRRTMQHLIGTDNFQKMRPMTRDAEVESAFATMGMSEHVRETLEEQMVGLAEEAKEAEKQEEQIERQEEKAEGIRDEVRANEGQISPQQQEELNDAVNRKHNAQSRLEKAMENMAELPMTMGTVAGLNEAAEQGLEDAKLIASLPGVGPGERQKLSPEEAINLAQMFKESNTLQKVAEMVGRILRDMRFKRARRITGGREEVVDIELGNHLPSILPAEKMLLMEEMTELDFMRRYQEHALLQYEERGTEDAGYGPLIICRDESYSMNGQRNIWAQAVCLALIAIARRERRDAIVIAYASGSEQEMWRFAHNELFDPTEVVDMASHFFSGGTDATPAIRMAVAETESITFNKADLVLISDGEDSFQDDDQTLRDTLSNRGIRVHGVMIGGAPTEYQHKMCDTLVSAYDLAGANDATSALAANIS
jgi:uncharacterized protein with von Willebrand factor type A (vWA) domain